MIEGYQTGVWGHLLNGILYKNTVNQANVKRIKTIIQLIRVITKKDFLKLFLKSLVKLYK